MHPTSTTPLVRPRDLAGAHPQARVPALPEMRFLRDPAAILAMQPRLAELAAACGQTGEADSLAYFLARPDARKRRPCLLLFSEPGTGLAAAVLTFEYLTLNGKGSSKVFSTTDESGRRGLLAPAGQRTRVAGTAAAAMLQEGAHVVKIECREDHIEVERGAGLPAEMPGNAPESTEEQRRHWVAAALRQSEAPHPPAHWALRERYQMLYLPLLPTYDATLASIGQKTRANLRYYRRRAEAALGCSFTPRADISRQEFMELSRRSFAPVSEAEAALRFRLLGTSPRDYLAGLRDRAGNWLSLVRGRTQHGIAEIDWQLNRADLPEFSLSTVMRAYLIEHMVTTGCARLYMEGGTATPLQHSFRWGRVTELTMKRDSLYVRGLALLSSRVPNREHMAVTLRNRDLAWTAW